MTRANRLRTRQVVAILWTEALRLALILGAFLYKLGLAGVFIGSDMLLTKLMSFTKSPALGIAKVFADIVLLFTACFLLAAGGMIVCVEAWRSAQRVLEDLRS